MRKDYLRKDLRKGKPGGGMMKLSAIAEKRRCWKAWKQGGGREQYLQAKQNAKRTVNTATKTADTTKSKKVVLETENHFCMTGNQNRSMANLFLLLGKPFLVDRKPFLN